jgi:hypothetical protein
MPAGPRIQGTRYSEHGFYRVIPHMLPVCLRNCVGGTAAFPGCGTGQIIGLQRIPRPRFVDKSCTEIRCLQTRFWLAWMAEPLFQETCVYCHTPMSDQPSGDILGAPRLQIWEQVGLHVTRIAPIMFCKFESRMIAFVRFINLHVDRMCSTL